MKIGINRALLLSICWAIITLSSLSPQYAFSHQARTRIAIFVSDSLTSTARTLSGAKNIINMPPTDMAHALPGGNALAFDWRLLAGRDWPLPWMLSGGLDAGNVAEAVAISGAASVDVSSGVEDGPGRKNPAKIAVFLKAVAAL